MQRLSTDFHPVKRPDYGSLCMIALSTVIIKTTGRLAYQQADIIC